MKIKLSLFYLVILIIINFGLTIVDSRKSITNHYPFDMNIIRKSSERKKDFEDQTQRTKSTNEIKKHFELNHDLVLPNFIYFRLDRYQKRISDSDHHNKLKEMKKVNTRKAPLIHLVKKKIYD
jgi:hypothetical protein